MQLKTSRSDSRPIFPHNFRNHPDFDNPFINVRGFIYLGISKMSFTFYVLTTVQGRVSKNVARKANVSLHA